jgi:methylmalonyl-CoA epimerase
MERGIDLFKGINDVTVAVTNVEEAASRLGPALGATPSEPEVLRDPGIEAIFSSIRLGDQSLTLMQDSSGSGPVAKFLNTRGEGLYSIIVEVSNLDAAIAHMHSAGVDFVEDEPRVLTNYEHRGFVYPEITVAWVHPKSTHGILMELQEFPDTEA